MRDAASRFKIYRQFKMYNDPALNPAIYGEKQARLRARRRAHRELATLFRPPGSPRFAPRGAHCAGAATRPIRQRNRARRPGSPRRMHQAAVRETARRALQIRPSASGSGRERVELRRASASGIQHRLRDVVVARVERVVRFSGRPHEDGIEPQRCLNCALQARTCADCGCFFGRRAPRPSTTYFPGASRAREPVACEEADAAGSYVAGSFLTGGNIPRGTSKPNSGRSRGRRSGGSGSVKPGYFDASAQRATVRAPRSDKPRRIARGDSSPLATITQS
jgi:hypothetical protein